MTTTPYAGGGGGSDFERRVATAFICHGVTGVPCPPFNYEPSKIWLQGGHLGCKLDDMVVEISAKDQMPRKRAYFSVKSSIKFTPSDQEFRETIQKGWIDFNNREVFEPKTDILGLFVASNRSDSIYSFLRLTELAQACNDAVDFHRRLSLKGYIRNSVKVLLENICDVLDRCEPAQFSETVFQFLRHFYIRSFDFDEDASFDRARTIGILRLAIESRDQTAADNCWNDIFERTSLGNGKARVFDSEMFGEIIKLHGLVGNVDQRATRWLTALHDHCRLSRNGIFSTLRSTCLHLKRDYAKEPLREALDSHRIILISGPAGSGKSALAADVAEEFAGREHVFNFSANEFVQPHLDTALQAAGLKDILLKDWSALFPLCPRILIVDGIEHLLESTGPRDAFNQLLREIYADPRWKLILTCRDYLSDEARIFEDSTAPWKVIEVPLLEPEEVQQAINGTNIPPSLLSHPVVAEALRSLKWLDLTLIAYQGLQGEATREVSWSKMAEWRRFVWDKLLRTDADVRTSRHREELLIQLGVERTLNGHPWADVNPSDVQTADSLIALGLVQKLDPHFSRFRLDHDLIEDWALLRYVERCFDDHKTNPMQFFGATGSSLIIRRAFRQFFGELLEGSQQIDGICFLRLVMKDLHVPRIWREEAIVALLGATNATEVLHTTSDLWIEGNAEGFIFLVHCLRVAYLGTPLSENEESIPLGPGWAALLNFIDQLQPEFLTTHLRLIFDLLIEWRHAVRPESPQPSGHIAAASLTRKIWGIATESNESLEKLLGEESFHMLPSKNRLAWLVAATAEGLGEDFFSQIVAGMLEEPIFSSSENHNLQIQSRELIAYLASESAGWTVARSFPETMIRICERFYGLEPPPQPNRYRSYSAISASCGLFPHDMEFTPPSALHGPFLNLLRYHPNLGKAFLLRLLNAAITRYVEQPSDNPYIVQPQQIELIIDGKEVLQWADQGWWRCYRGNSPYPELLECCLMALEKWLLEDVAITTPDKLQDTLIELILKSQNIAITAVAASVANVQPSLCGKIIVALLKSPLSISLDRQRFIADQRFGKSGGFSKNHNSYERERSLSNEQPQRKESLEQTILKAQFYPAKEEIWSVLDDYHRDLSVTEQTEEIKIFRLLLHRVDARNLVARKDEDYPGYILLEAKPPTDDLQCFITETGANIEERTSPMNMQLWAWQFLEPLETSSTQPERWKEMLTRAQTLSFPMDDQEGQLAFGGAGTLVASACVRNFWEEMDNEQQSWCIQAITDDILQDVSLTPWERGGLLTASPLKVHPAQALAHLLGKFGDSVPSICHRALAVALTHPESRIVEATAKELGAVANPKVENLQIAGCELLFLHARLCRNVDFKYRSARVKDDLTWDQRRGAMHTEILAQTEILRKRFTDRAPAQTLRLTLLYPRGFEENEVLAAMLSSIVHQNSETTERIFSRAFKWLIIQWLPERRNHRLFGRDRWRKHDVSQPTPSTLGNVSEMIAAHILQQSPTDAVDFVMKNLFTNLRVVRLRKNAGELLKDMCIRLDTSGKAETFWAVWQEYRDITQYIGARLNNDSFWKEQGISKECAVESFSHLLSSVFLKDMHWHSEHEWNPLKGEEPRFTEAFSIFGIFAFHRFIEFLGTVGGALLPAAWVSLSDCLNKFQKISSASNFLDSKRKQILLRLIQNEVVRRRITHDDVPSWTAIRHLLDYLVDGGSPEAYRLRDSLPRTFQTGPSISQQ